ncbi:MAG: carboxypeptidase-like regulatory domain-containing protein, partial [Planctomycetota bacterium]
PSFQRNPQQPSLAGFIANVVTDGRQPFAVPPQGRPIRGRLIDIDGQPISGARIRIRYCVENRDNHARPPANEEERVLRRREKLNQLDVIEHVPIRFAAPSVTSNEDGRFEMIEIPDNHLFQLLVEGDNVASTDLMVRNFGDEMITVPPPRHTPAAPDTLLYPADFEAVIGPSVPIRGVVSDLDSGAPIANAVVRATDVHGERVRSSRERQHFATRTDEQGRYEITGMPIGSGNRLVAFTDGQLPYIPVGFNADTSTGSDSVQLDTKMRRGLWASGRVFDAETKEPFQGEVSYFSFLTDSVDEQYPGSKWAFLDGRYFTNANGEFKLPVMRAPGVIAFSTGNRSPGLMAKFPRGLGTHELEQFRDPKDGYYRTAPHYLHPGNFNRVALVDPGIDEDDVVVDLPLESSPPIKVSILGPSGEPYEPEVEFYGGNERYGWYATRRRPLVIEDLLPHQSRKAFAFDRNRQLIGGIIVRHGQEAPFELRMQKAGSVRGRLLDKDGSPIVDAHITVDYGKFQEDDVTGMWAAVKGQSANPTQIQVDEQGRFSIVGLSPDWIYSAHADHRRMGFTRVFGDVFKDLKIKPGESRDLGDVVLDDG